MRFQQLFILTAFLMVCSCANSQSTQDNQPISTPSQAQEQPVIVGAEQLDSYLPYLQGKRVGMVVNQTSAINNQHLVDVLLGKEIKITKVFAPEHGFRGTADAGEKVKDGVDAETGLPVISLYGSNRKPSKEQLSNVDVIVFDIQDVGVRFYTYISTLEYVLEASAENNKTVIVLDRPNPNGFYVDGPILDKELKSFVGMQRIPVVHGLTVGEYAKMLVGEQWINKGLQPDLIVIPNQNYTHTTRYELPIAPSPNLPNQQSILLYPSLCFFEGANMSIGRGTNKQFQIVGAPNYKGSFEFYPTSMAGAKHPKFEGKLCYGEDLSNLSQDQLYNSGQLQMQYLVEAYNYFAEQNQDFFLKSNFFDKLAGTYQLREQLKAGKTVEQIRQSWQEDLKAYKQIRKKYLLYPDFE